MCACEPGFTCDQCRDAPLDPFYFWDEPDPPHEVFAETSDA